MNALIAWAGLAVVAGGIVALTAVLLRKPMESLFMANFHLAPAAKFYRRTLTMVLAVATLAVVVGGRLPCPQQSATLVDSASWIVYRLEPVCGSIAGFLMGYVLLLTILFAVLGRYRDQ